jgi:aspartyl protease family protein
MLRFATVAIIGALSAAAATTTAQALIAFARAQTPATANAPLRPAQALAISPQPAPAVGSPGQVIKSPDGHFWAEGEVDGHQVRFLVDTGASAVALTQDDAMRLGLSPQSLAYTYQVNTASGVTRAARVTLDSISVGGAEVHDVDAYVIENGLPTSLLGMTYLGRLSQFEATQTALVLRP